MDKKLKFLLYAIGALVVVAIAWLAFLYAAYGQQVFLENLLVMLAVGAVTFIVSTALAR